MGFRPVRVALSDNSIHIRESLARVLADAGFEVIGQTDTADELLALVRLTAPDVVIIDIDVLSSRASQALTVALEIHHEEHPVKIVLLAHRAELKHLHVLMAHGSKPMGYLLKQRVLDAPAFCETVRAVARGRSVIDPEVTLRLVKLRRSENVLDELSGREREVLHLMAQGCSNLAIGQALFLSPKTVEAHVRSIFAKLALEPNPDEHRRVKAVIIYLEHVEHSEQRSDRSIPDRVHRELERMRSHPGDPDLSDQPVQDGLATGGSGLG